MKQPSIVLLALLALQGCVSATVDEIIYEGGASVELGDASVVILGRRHASDYETEPDFIECIGDHIRAGDRSINVVPESEFVDALYPWFEPRTAPLRPTDIERLLQVPPVQEKLKELKTEYMVWVDGQTERTDGAGSLTCAVGLGAIGCFGFGTWDNDAKYEAVIWNFSDRQEVGRIRAEVKGTSYMPAVVIPIPFVAPVQGTACDGLGRQLLEFFSAKH